MTIHWKRNVFIFINLVNVIKYATATCINGKKNGESWTESCKACYCSNDKIICKTLCRRRDPTEFLQRQSMRSNDQVKPSKPALLHGACSHDNIQRKHNETWNEVGQHASSLDATKECMQCNCNKGNVICTIRQCAPTTCLNPIRREGTCCLVCPDDVKEQSATDVCYESGSVFTESTTWRMYLPSGDNRVRCLECTCKREDDGELHIVCPKHSCPQLSCADVVGKPRQCCGNCKDGASVVSNTTTNHKEDEESYLPFTFLFNNKPIPNPSQNKRKKKIILTKKGEKDCSLDNTIYKDGETFMPYGGCIRCLCQNSHVSCSKVMCRRDGNCKHPVKRSGLCCPVCPGVSTSEAKIQEQKNIFAITNRNKGCSSKSRIKVYEHQSVKKDSSTLRRLYLFDRTAIGQPAEMHSWVLQGDKTEVIVSEILDARLMANWTYLGSIKEKVLKRILRHVEELKHLTGRLLCIKKISWLQNLIKERSAKRKRVCKSIPSTNFETRGIFKSLKEGE
ncbi:chordin-like protein 1 isoform X2 [Hydractinia symbiolongicarpus]|uniref:chordin-like protein 1 isoform X2 n=1 Tax=Hydractinia symbiolongicarpus TaxID=13093 RepID=UPI00254AB8BA|nr:chordin-like protein 1 isoform X2 [Hydractinia symbiolongicarpus]